MARPVFTKQSSIAKRTSAVEPAARFISSGSTLFDLVLGGGWGCGRIANIVGDKSSGKTLCAIEACANLVRIAPISNIRYIEAEAAFDEEYGRSMGFPAGLKVIDTVRTVEEFFADITDWLEVQKKNALPCLYVVDSLDALSDTAEMERAEDKGSYGANKAKKLSEFFRKKTRDLSQAHCTLFIVSQIRDKMNVMFGETKTRSGGRSLDFYASQVVWLIEQGKIKRQVLGVERVVGLKVMIRNRKNKLGLPYTEAESTLILNYGFDDEMSMVEWLHKCKAIQNAPVWRDAITQARTAKDRTVINDLNMQLKQLVTERWHEINVRLAPSMSKYGG